MKLRLSQTDGGFSAQKVLESFTQGIKKCNIYPGMACDGAAVWRVLVKKCLWRSLVILVCFSVMQE